jgi:hypothetical protein
MNSGLPPLRRNGRHKLPKSSGRGITPFDLSPARALVVLIVVLCATVFLPGCSGFVLHDEARSKLASDTKQSYTDAKITEVVDADRKNLETLLAAELDVVRESSRYEVDYALLALANNTTPMGKTVLSAMDRIKELGLPSVAELRGAQDKLALLDTVQSQLGNDFKGLAELKIPVPDCNADTVSTKIPPSLTGHDAKAYADFLKHCTDMLNIKIAASGRLGAAIEAWKNAKLALDKSVAEQETARAALKKAKKAYDDQVADASDPKKKGQDFTKKIAEKANELADTVKDAKKLDKSLESEPFIDSLVDLLTATAGGDVDPKDPALQGAVAVAKQIPSLAGDIVALEAERTAPPLAGLLIALRHQTLLAEMAKQRAALAAEHVAILKTKYELYLQAAERWLRFFDGVCSYAVLSAGKEFPRDKCDKFKVQVRVQNVVAVECVYENEQLKDCRLERPWKERLRAQDKPEIKRQLYGAVAAYLQALTLQERPLEQSFREIDVLHRETLLAKQTAIEQWDNLVGVPLDQLEAYYKAGVKPAELADLIVKALGFTAIAIGVSK